MSCEGRTVCRGCGMHTWINKFGCSLPGCPQYAAHLAESIEAAERELASGDPQTLDEILEQDKDLLDRLAAEDRDGAGTPPAGTPAMPVPAGSGAADASATDARTSEPAPSPDLPRQQKITTDRYEDWYEHAEFACPHCDTELIAPWQPCPKCGRND